MSSRHFNIGLWGAVAICLLRVGVGWHFFKEGEKKFHGDGFTSLYFLEQATGPWGEFYQSWIPDRYGVERLNRELTLNRWTAYRDRVTGQLRLSKDQIDNIWKEQQAQLDWFFDVNGADIEEYLLEVDRYQKAKVSNLRDVRFERDWLQSKAAELKGKSMPWLKSLKKLEKNFEDSLYAASSQPVRRQSLDIPSYLPILDASVKYMVVGVGILMLLGLFTRLACCAGAAFLLSVMATQPPWVAGAQTMHFYYQLVEVLAFFALAACGAGYFGGLDYIIHGLRSRDDSSHDSKGIN